MLLDTASPLWTAAGIAIVIVIAKIMVLSKKRIRHSKYTCRCGKVQADLHVRPLLYGIVEQPSSMCCCTDCVGFCEKVLQSSRKGGNEIYLTPGVRYMVFFNKEITLEFGQEHLRHVNISKKGTMRRTYTKCCGTPMAVTPENVGVSMLYPENIQECSIIADNETPVPDITPTVCLHYASNKFTFPEPPPETRIVPNRIAPRFIFQIIARMLVTSLFYKGTGHGFPVTGQVDIGMDTIGKKS